VHWFEFKPFITDYPSKKAFVKGGNEDASAIEDVTSGHL
jgi:hypothetical protein